MGVSGDTVRNYISLTDGSPCSHTLEGADERDESIGGGNHTR